MAGTGREREGAGTAARGGLARQALQRPRDRAPRGMGERHQVTLSRLSGQARQGARRGAGHRPFEPVKPGVPMTC